MKVIVVADEKRVVQKLEKALKSIDESLPIIGIAPGIFNSEGWNPEDSRADLILIGEHLAQAVSRLQQSRISAIVIFSLPSEQFAFQAFRLANIHPKQLLLHLHHIDSSPEPDREKQPASAYGSHFLVKQGQKFSAIPVINIAYFFSEGRFVFLRPFTAKKNLVEYTLEEVEKMVPPQDFFRINRSLLAAFSSVAQLYFRYSFLS